MSYPVTGAHICLICENVPFYISNKSVLFLDNSFVVHSVKISLFLHADKSLFRLSVKDIIGCKLIFVECNCLIILFEHLPLDVQRCCAWFKLPITMGVSTLRRHVSGEQQNFSRSLKMNFYSMPGIGRLNNFTGKLEIIHVSGHPSDSYIGTLNTILISEGLTV